MSPPDELHELGRRIRKVRIERRMTLKQVEAVSGLSATHLSEIERARTSPTLGALIRIARSLRKEPAFFLEGEELDDVAHTRREEAPSLDLPRGVTAEVLTPGIPGSEICAYRLKLDPARSAVLRISPQDVTGDMLYIAMRGSIEATIGDEQMEVSEGDAVHASLTLPHRVKPVSEEPAELIVIATRRLEETSKPATEEQ
jgi:transcriptional regulator with XRE-family HTH domain